MKNIPTKQSKIKESLIEQLKKVPIIQLACERVGISRMTFYRWKKEDKQFAEAVDEALVSSVSIINDMAESKLISAIKDGHMTGIIYWLKHHHPAYATRVELSMQNNRPQDALTPEQQAVVNQALGLSGLIELTPESQKNEKLSNKSLPSSTSPRAGTK